MSTAFWEKGLFLLVFECGAETERAPFACRDDDESAVMVQGVGLGGHGLDGDGFCDIQEGSNEGEGVSLCERFDASRHPDGVEPECSLDYNLAMLATELVQMNDRAYCVDLQGNYCPVASYDSEGDNPYGVVLGVQAKVGNVYSAKSVFMRDYSVVYGNVETGGIIERQSPTPLIYCIATENADQEKLYGVIYASVFGKIINGTGKLLLKV